MPGRRHGGLAGRLVEQLESRRERLGTWFRVYELDYRGRRIWGATATMLVTIMDILFDEESIA